MTTRHLDNLFAPASVAVIGASLRPASVGGTVWRNLKDGGFAGSRWAVNPKHDVLEGEPCYADVARLPGTPGLAVVATPPATVPGIVAALGACGTRAVIVLTAGLSPQQKQAMLEAARPHTLRLLGPNGLGLLAPHVRLNASFAPSAATAGSLAFVSQSGALLTAVLDWAQGRGIGFSQCVSLGEQADVDFGDVIDWLASDSLTRAVLLYIESVPPGAVRKFMSAVRGAARNKPVIVVKAGRSSAGQAAAASHTGALAGADLVFDAALRRAGALRVDTLDDLFLAAETLAHFQSSWQPGPQAGSQIDTQGLTIVTNGGGAGVLAADAAAQAGVPLVPLSAESFAALNAVLPANWSHANPVDLIGDAPVARYVSTLNTLLADAQTGTVLFIHAPTAIVPSAQIAQALLALAKTHGNRLLTCWLGDGAAHEARRLFRTAAIADYDTPEQAVRALSLLQTYRGNQAQLMQTPASRGTSAEIDVARVRDAINQALADKRVWLDAAEVQAVLEACRIPTVATRRVAAEADAAVAAADQIGYPVVLKIASRNLTHKSDVGGVVLNLADAATLRAAAAAMLQRVATLAPTATLDGFVVQAMVRRPRAIELIVGASIDALFGPVLLFGQGGTAVEVLADRAVALPPLNATLAQALIDRTRVANLLAGWRDVPAADTAAVTAVLCAVAQLLAEEPRIAELDINPLLADAQGVIALDARVRVEATAPGGGARFAIRPYPSEWVEPCQWRGRALTLRPIRPEDEAQHRTFLQALDPEDIRLRVFYSRRNIEHSELARLTQIDYDRELAFIATEAQADSSEQTLGVVRAICDPDNREAEFGILVRSDLKGQGLGLVLMDKLIGHLRERGTQFLVASVLKENERMLKLARHLGFEVAPSPSDNSAWALRMPLR